MNDAKYIGFDVHQATISAAVLDSADTLVMEAILEKKAETILQFIHGLRGRLQVTFEEGTQHVPAALHLLFLLPKIAILCSREKSRLFGQNGTCPYRNRPLGVSKLPRSLTRRKWLAFHRVENATFR